MWLSCWTRHSLKSRVLQSGFLLITARLATNFMRASTIIESCHLDRSRRRAAPEAEWRDPDNVSSTMQIRGIRPSAQRLLARRVQRFPLTRFSLTHFFQARNALGRNASLLAGRAPFATIA